MTEAIAAERAEPHNILMPTTPASIVADIAARHPSSIDVFERHGIDFCCGGHRSLQDACRDKGLSAAVVADEIDAAAARETPTEPIWTDAPLGDLVDHIVSRYHVGLRETLPRLGRMADKVAEIHGSRHPELPGLAQTFHGLKAELDAHLAVEEELFFPAVRALGEAGIWTDKLQAALHGLLEEHTVAGSALARLRSLSAGFTVPEDGCSTYRALYEGLLRLERDLHEHVHLENNVLYRRVVDLAKRKG